MADGAEGNTTSNVNDHNLILEYPIISISWIIGIVLSSLCLILQLVLFKIKPEIRKFDQKILTQLTVARIVNTLIEFLLDFQRFDTGIAASMLVMFQQTDAVLVCWMFVYTKNLYDKVVLVFALQKWNFIVLSLLIWILTIPIGVLCPVFYYLGYYDQYSDTYAFSKFIVLSLNLFLFCSIFYVIVVRTRDSNRDFTDILKTGVISFILVCVTSLQVFINDILSYVDIQSNVFSVLNSYQCIAVTIMFLIRARNMIRDHKPDLIYVSNDKSSSKDLRLVPELFV